MAEDKLYRIKTKDGAHMNDKLKEDGSRAALQFDENNGLQGPVDLIEADESDYTRKVYVEVGPKERSFGQIILEDSIAPALLNVLTIVGTRVLESGINALGNFMSRTVIPAAKAKGGEIINKARDSQTKKGLTQGPEALNKKTDVAAAPSKRQDCVGHTPEEVNQMLNNMRFAALYIAAGIRELSNTVITNDGADPAQKLAMEEQLKQLSSDKVMNSIEFMLEDRNRDVLDQATIQLFEAFRHKDFIIEGKAVPISRYLSATTEEEGPK